MTVESEKDLAGLRRVGRVVGLALREMRENLEPGMTTGELEGVGRTVHEPPTIPNYHDRLLRTQLTEGLVITVEPIISAGSSRTVEGSDGWTNKDRRRQPDGPPRAHARRHQGQPDSPDRSIRPGQAHRCNAPPRLASGSPFARMYGAGTT